jgi:signal transduction histidine kinase
MFATAALVMPRDQILTTRVGDLTDFLLTLIVGVVMVANAWSTTGVSRRFWALMGSGFLLWAFNLGGWAYYEGVLRVVLPDPWSMDVCLFLHLIPMIAALALRPHRAEEGQKFRAGALDFFLLLVWWIFLYAFVVFPAQYIVIDTSRYDHNFGALYMVESGVLVLMLAIVVYGAKAGWKRFYLHLMLASAFYAAASQVVNVAVSTGKYYSGSMYDVPLIACISWIAAAALSARGWNMGLMPQNSGDKDRWGAMALGGAMLAMLSLPVLGLWTFLWDASPALTRTFRLFTVLTAMLVLGIFLFLRQYLQDRALIHVLEESRRSFETEQRLQSHLVQREKLASLGEMIAGAAHEIDNPLTAIMQDSEQLWSAQRLTNEQDTLVRKIVQQAQRTRDLIGNLLSFARQSSGEKNMVDVRMLLQRSVQMRGLQSRRNNIRIETSFEATLPRVWGDGHQLFQTFVELVENALEALEDAGGGLLRVTAYLHGEEIVLHFSDSGRGIKEPHRVFDPFYTTKPVGKGTGLGLSAVYGVIQEHSGQITCQNNPEGGASFVLRLPAAPETSSRALAAAQV